MSEGLSERAACRLANCPRRTFQYRLRRFDEPHIIERIRAIAAERPRFGWRRINVLLQREGIVLNHKRLRRIIVQSNSKCELERGGMSATCEVNTSIRRPDPMNVGPRISFTIRVGAALRRTHLRRDKADPPPSRAGAWKWRSPPEDVGIKAPPTGRFRINRSERWMDYHILKQQGLSIRKIAALRA
jgi:hypothetical protein